MMKTCDIIIIGPFTFSILIWDQIQLFILFIINLVMMWKFVIDLKIFYSTELILESSYLVYSPSPNSHNLIYVNICLYLSDKSLLNHPKLLISTK